MYYSSSSSGGDDDENDDKFNGPIHRAASSDLVSSSHGSDDEPFSSTGRTHEAQNFKSLSSNPLSSIPRSDDIRIAQMKEEEDDREVISNLKLEEKIVSQMNRIWILETENDALQSRLRYKGGRVEIRNLYQSPYASPSGIRQHQESEISTGDNMHNNKNNSSNRTLSGNKTKALFPQISPFSEEILTRNDNSNNINEMGATLRDLQAQNRSLRKDLEISESAQKSVKEVMVSLETIDIDEISKELENMAKALVSVREELETEKFKTQKLKTEHEEITKKQQQQLQRYESNQSIGKESFEGSRTSGTYSLKIGHESSVKAAQLISDLSNELKMTIERESELKEELKVSRHKIKEQATKICNEEDSRNNSQIEIDALMEHNEELEILNIKLVKQLVTLETKNKDLARANQERKISPRFGRNNNNSNNSLVSQNYLNSMTTKYEQSQREIKLLKGRLSLSQTESSEFWVGSTSAARPPQAKEPWSTQKERSIREEDEEEYFEMLWKEGEDTNDFTPSEDLPVPDEQREDEHPSASTVFSTRFEI